jgi:hypothetical protein
MKRIIAMLLALILLFTSTGEILASEIASLETDVLSVNEMELPTGLQEVEAIAIPVSELTGEILDYRELAEISTYSAVYAKEWDKYSTNYYYNQLPLEWKKLWDAMDTVCLSYLTSSANVEKAMFDAVSTPSGMTLDELHIFWQMFIYSNPQYYFLLNKYSYSYYNDILKQGICQGLFGKTLLFPCLFRIMEEIIQNPQH